jgi:cell division protein FtsQ
VNAGPTEPHTPNGGRMKAAGRFGMRESFTLRTRRQNVSRRATAARRRLWLGRLASLFWAAGGAAVVVFVGFFFVFVHDVLTQSEQFKARTIQIEGGRRLTAKTLASVAGVREGVNVLSVNLSTARKRLLAQPWIAEAEIRREIPSTLHIRIREHVPAAIVDVGKKFLLNARGEVFKEWEPADPAGLPVVSGLKIADLRVADRSGAGAALPLAVFASKPRPEASPSRSMEAVLQVLALGGQSGSVLSTQSIRSIRVDRELGITVQAYDEGKSIRLGYDDFASKFRLLADLLTFLKSQPGLTDFDRIDLTDANRVIVNPAKADLPVRTGPKGG